MVKQRDKEMTTRSDVVSIEINGTVFDADCDYEYEPHVPAKLDGLPEDCYPEEPEHIGITGLVAQINGKPVILDYLLEVESITDELEEQLRDEMAKEAEL